MSVYTVHEPPLRAADALADPERFIFVRDGFYTWALLLTPLWLLWRRLWLVLAGYLLVSAVIDTALVIAGVSPAVIVVVAGLISLLAGLEASTLRRFTLRRRGWRNVGIVSGDDPEDAERRFFDRWVRKPPAAPGAPSPATPVAPAATMPRMPQAVTPQAVTPQAMTSQAMAPGASGVIGLFPEPGGPR